MGKHFTIYVERDPELPAGNDWVAVVNMDDGQYVRTIGRAVVGSSVFDALTTIAPTIDKAEAA